MNVYLKQLNLNPKSDFETLKATASCVIYSGNKWILIKGFCVWEKSGRVTISNPPKFGAYGNPFNQYISMNVTLKEKIHRLILTAFEKERFGKRGLIRNKIAIKPETSNSTISPNTRKTKFKDTFSLQLVLEDGEERILFKGLGVKSGKFGFLKGGVIEPTRQTFVFSPSMISAIRPSRLAKVTGQPVGNTLKVAL